jgi:O-acetyl-ADP-ribose deacetylase (regulator of RNase III)
MEVINKDILTVKRGIICHQCNCIGAMGAGLAKQIRDRWPHIYADYRKAIETGELRLGGCRIATAEPGLYIAHLAGQHGIGRRKFGRPATEYLALSTALNDLNRQINGSYVFMRMPVYIPYGIGCGLGGGDWKEVSKILEEDTPGITICKYQ